MGIDKSDIQSVIHFDMPKSIENYVQEIGRAGRDGKLARCHLMLNNGDFLQLRKFILADLLDFENAYKLVNKVLKTIRQYFSVENASKKSKKRGRKEISGASDSEEEDEEEEKVPQTTLPKAVNGWSKLDEPVRVYVNVKDSSASMDLRREVVLTMLSQLEKTHQGEFLKFENIVPVNGMLRFHAKQPEEMAEEDDFIRSFLELSKCSQGVYRCYLPTLAEKLGISIPDITRKFFHLQRSESVAYDLADESFCLLVKQVPSSVSRLPQEVLQLTQKIEHCQVSKLNCMYFVARKTSLPTVDYMLKNREKMNVSQKLNQLINLYFGIEDESTMEV